MTTIAIEKSVNKPKAAEFKVLNKVFCIYLYLLPIRMVAPLSFMEVFGAVSTYIDFIFNIIGIVIIMLISKGVIRISDEKSERLFRLFFASIMMLNLISVIMSIYLYNKVSVIGGENTFNAITAKLVHFIHYIFIVYFNKELFKVVDIKKIKIILEKVFRCLLALGYLQIFIITLGKRFSELYNSLDILGILQDADLMIRIGRITLTEIEPAYAGAMIGILIFPYIMSNILMGIAVKKNAVKLLLWMPVLFFTKSSTAYILAAIAFLMFVYIFYTKKKIKLSGLILLFVFISLTLSIFALSNMDTYVFDTVHYNLIEKITDRSNLSTVSRTIPVIINWEVFLQYPIMGVGNGNQGFFYAEYFPSWGYVSKRSVEFINSSEGVADGSLFVLGNLSAYGIIGVLIIGVYIMKANKLIESGKRKIGIFYYMYKISIVVIFIHGFSSDFVGKYWIWFVLSLPYMVNRLNQNKNTDLSDNS